MHVLILANGDPPSLEQLETERQSADFFIATDGAANYLVSLGIRPNVVLGDFDSLSDNARRRYADILIEADDQESCDLDKAIAYAVGNGAITTTILGATGGRTDHMLSTISILMKYSASVDVCVKHGNETIRVVSDFINLVGAPGDTLSLVVFERVEGVCEEGVRWPLTDATLTPGSRGVSNRFLGIEARVSVKSGALIVCHTHGRNS